MKLFPLIAIVLLVSACHRDRGNNAQAALAEAYLQQLQGQHPGMTDACVQKIRSGEIGLTDWIDNPDCFDMTADQRWSGLWDIGWEWSNFCPDTAGRRCARISGPDSWLIFAKDAYRGGRLEDGTYRIQFIGRQTKVRGYFGHLDQYPHLTVVDRMISIQKIPGVKYTRRF